MCYFLTFTTFNATHFRQSKRRDLSDKTSSEKDLRQLELEMAGNYASRWDTAEADKCFCEWSRHFGCDDECKMSKNKTKHSSKKEVCEAKKKLKIWYYFNGKFDPYKEFCESTHFT